MDFAPGLTVVHGFNEAGKSTWHAALYAALCGRRRGRGANTLEERLFAERHRPWGGGPWVVGAELELADGRKIEMKQDLEGKIDCSARDGLGRDVSGEIIFEGAPDASRWLGLDRRAFLATACVRQSEISQVLDDAGSLQEHLQRAAATAGTDATAARALELVDIAIRERVGREAVNSVRPLRRAMNREATASRRLTTINDAHIGYLDLLGQALARRATATTAGDRVQELEAVQAEAEARREEQKVARVEEVLARHPDGPPSAPKDEALANEVAAALSGWRTRPAPPSQEGTSSEDLRKALGDIPPRPEGDLEPAEEVVRALSSMRAATAAMSGHLAGRPQETPSPAVTLAPAELLDLASRIEEAVPRPDKALQQRVEAARASVASTTGSRAAYAMLGGAAALLIGAAAAVAFGIWQVGALGVLGMLVLGWLGVSRLRTGGSGARLEQLRDLEGQLARIEAAIAGAENRKQAALATIRAHGLPSGSVELRALSAAVEAAGRARYVTQQWETQREVIVQQVADQASRLREALERRGVVVRDPDDLDAAIERYGVACRTRAQQAREAGRREGLEQQLRMREELENAAEKSRRAIAEAEMGLRKAAEACGVGSDLALEQVEAGLEGWGSTRARRVAAAQIATTEWSEMQTLLAGRTEDQLGGETAELRENANRLAVAIGRPEGIEPDPSAAAALPEQRQRAQVAAGDVANLEGRLSTIDPASVDVAGAEEELAAATAELARVRALENILLKTQRFLEVAQDRVHRDIAPVLTATLQKWLPSVTGGRWTDATVDPENLLVHVRAPGGDWREAPLLSEGTMEQIYLLLRMAMVKHLTHAGESCPLILDDVTIHCDSNRKRALLGLLLAISEERQVILFAQEQEVREWAEACLLPPDHDIHVLSELPVPT